MMTNKITAGAFDTFADNLLQKITTLIERKQEAPRRRWLKSSEVRKLLSMSAGTLQNLRQTGILPFTKIGGIILYDYNDIEQLIDDQKTRSAKTRKPARKSAKNRDWQFASATQTKATR